MFFNEIAASRKYTLHSHTQFCDGHAPMRDFVVAAVERGFTHYGFSPHSPLPIASPCNMTVDSVPQYLAEVESLKTEFGSQIQLYAGMEIDYLNPNWGPANDYFLQLPLDYRIGSVHFVKNQKGEFFDIDGSADRFKEYLSVHFRGDLDYVVKAFFEASAEMLERGGFDIIGHYDKIAQNASVVCEGIEESGWFAKLADDLTELIIEKRVIVEINTKAKRLHNRIFPAERHLPRLVEAGVPILVNSDAHYPDLIDSSRDYAFELLSSAERP